MSTAENNATTRDQLLLQWQQSKLDLERAKEAESKLRLQCVMLCFPDAKEGMNTLELGNGYKLKCDNKLNYSLSNSEKAGFLTNKALTALMSLGGEWAFIAKRLVKWSPELSLSEWRNLPEEQQKLFTMGEVPALKITPGMPALSIEEPKAQK